MPKIILCRGIQGSGKTTWAKQWALEDPEEAIRKTYGKYKDILKV
jgi:predicted kinase